MLTYHLKRLSFVILIKWSPPHHPHPNAHHRIPPPPTPLKIISYCFYYILANHYILIFYHLYFYVCGISNLNRLIIFVRWYSLSIYTNDLSNLKVKRAILELWCKVQVYHAKLNLLFCLLSGHRHVETRVCYHWGHGTLKCRSKEGSSYCC